MVRENFFKIREKSVNFILSRRKLKFSRKRLGKIEVKHQCRLKEVFQVTVISTMFVP